MKKHPKLSLATALLVVGAALVIAQTNRPVTNGACCATFANPAMLASVIKTNAPPRPTRRQARQKRNRCPN